MLDITIGLYTDDRNNTWVSEVVFQSSNWETKHIYHVRNVTVSDAGWFEREMTTGGIWLTLYRGGDVAEIFALQEQVDFGESGPVGRVPLPALSHQIVYLSRTHRRSRQIPLTGVVLVPVIGVFDHLLASQFRVRLLRAQHQNLPECHGKRPDVAFCCLPTLKKKINKYK